jgi:F0F1-type ATP synthase assembly protein I
MKLSKEVLVGIVFGVFIGLPQGLRDLPGFTAMPMSPDVLAVAAGLGCVFGFFLGMHLLSRANSDPKKHGAFAGILVGWLCIGIPPIMRHFNGNLIQSINMVLRSLQHWV